MSSRREFLKKTAYVAPVVMTLAAKPSYAGHGSDRPQGSTGSDSRNRDSRNDRYRRQDSEHSRRKHGRD